MTTTAGPQPQHDIASHAAISDWKEAHWQACIQTSPEQVQNVPQRSPVCRAGVGVTWVPGGHVADGVGRASAVHRRAGTLNGAAACNAAQLYAQPSAAACGSKG